MRKIWVISAVVIAAIFIFTDCQQKNRGEISTYSGQGLYDHYCTGCHLNTGIGGPAPGGGVHAADIRQFNKTPEQLVDIITHGFGQMPAFGDSMSQEKIALIANYVSTNIEGH